MVCSPLDVLVQRVLEHLGVGGGLVVDVLVDMVVSVRQVGLRWANWNGLMDCVEGDHTKRQSLYTPLL